MKSIVINDTIIIFLNISDFEKFKNRELLELKTDYLKKYSNCIIYNYFDLKNNKKIIRDKINKLKFIDQKKVFARNCIIREINNDTKNIFLNQNHIQGADKSQINFGAYLGNDLLSVMSFNSNNEFNGGVSEGEYILSRFAVKTSYIIVGIFNKMLKNFIDTYNPQKITSYADMNLILRNNNIYLTNNFKFSRFIKPDYKFYHKTNDKIYHKFTFGNKFMKNSEISENEKNETLKNLIKVWNCGKIKYELIINNNIPVYGFIYSIENKINGKKYIGQTIRLLQKRIYEYKSAFNLNKFNNPYLLNAFKKYGWENFEFKIIDTASDIHELNEKEIEYIRKFDTTNKNKGYNIKSSGENAIPSLETLEKMSRSHKGIRQTDTWINKRIAKAGSDEAKKYGKIKTNEEKKILSKNSPKYWLGKSRDAETKEKISKTKKEKGLSDKQKEVLCKKVYKINIITNNIINYDSTKHASDMEGVNQSTISRWCKNEKNVRGFLWKY